MVGPVEAAAACAQRVLEAAVESLNHAVTGGGAVGLMKEMQSLCLNVEVLDTAGKEIEMHEFDDEIYRTAEELGIDISRPERGSDDDDRDRRPARAY